VGKIIQKYYRQFRKNGDSAKHALYSARILKEWEEEDGLVKLETEEEQENYFDVYGVPDTEKETKEMERILELYGCWCVIGKYRTEEREEWQWADSVRMCTGYKNVFSPFENEYAIGIMAETLSQLKKATFLENALITG